eukprot:354903-Chlamydomonas_euryale.AAC.39
MQAPACRLCSMHAWTTPGSPGSGLPFPSFPSFPQRFPNASFSFNSSPRPATSCAGMLPYYSFPPNTWMASKNLVLFPSAPPPSSQHGAAQLAVARDKSSHPHGCRHRQSSSESDPESEPLSVSDVSRGRDRRSRRPRRSRRSSCFCAAAAAAAATSVCVSFASNHDRSAVSVSLVSGCADGERAGRPRSDSRASTTTSTSWPAAWCPFLPISVVAGGGGAGRGGCSQSEGGREAGRCRGLRGDGDGCEAAGCRFWKSKDEIAAECKVSEGRCAKGGGACGAACGRRWRRCALTHACQYAGRHACMLMAPTEQRRWRVREPGGGGGR